MIEIILKVKNDSGTYWKTDMFWSLSDSRENAKIHTLTMNGEIKYHLLTNLIAVHNSYIEDKTNFDVNFYNNCKIGYDIIKFKDTIDFEFIKNGPFEYQIKYDSNKNIFKLIDIRRKIKL